MPPSRAGSGMCLFRTVGRFHSDELRPTPTMNAAVRLLVVAAIAGLLAYLTWPWLKNAMYLAELLAEEPPQSLPIPVKGVSTRAVRDTFGAPRPGDRTHQGIDIFAPR